MIQSGRSTRIYARTYTGQGKYKWTSHLSQLASLHTVAQHTEIADYPPALHDSARSSSFVTFACPSHHARPATNPSFNVLLPHHRIWCSVCKRVYASQQWQCPCRSPWIHCSLHCSLVTDRVETTSDARKRKHCITRQPMDEVAANQKLRKLEPIERCQRPLMGPNAESDVPETQF